MARSLGRSCIGKQSHPTKASALAHLISLAKISRERSTVYRCGWCESYHIGRRGKRTARR